MNVSLSLSLKVSESLSKALAVCTALWCLHRASAGDACTGPCAHVRLYLTLPDLSIACLVQCLWCPKQFVLAHALFLWLLYCIEQIGQTGRISWNQIGMIEECKQRFNQSSRAWAEWGQCRCMPVSPLSQPHDAAKDSSPHHCCHGTLVRDSL